MTSRSARNVEARSSRQVRASTPAHRTSRSSRSRSGRVVADPGQPLGEPVRPSGSGSSPTIRPWLSSRTYPVPWTYVPPPQKLVPFTSGTPARSRSASRGPPGAGRSRSPRRGSARGAGTAAGWRWGGRLHRRRSRATSWPSTTARTSDRVPPGVRPGDAELDERPARRHGTAPSQDSTSSTTARRSCALALPRMARRVDADRLVGVGDRRQHPHEGARARQRDEQRACRRGGGPAGSPAGRSARSSRCGPVPPTSTSQGVGRVAELTRPRSPVDAGRPVRRWVAAHRLRAQVTSSPAGSCGPGPRRCRRCRSCSPGRGRVCTDSTSSDGAAADDGEGRRHRVRQGVRHHPVDDGPTARGCAVPTTRSGSSSRRCATTRRPRPTPEHRADPDLVAAQPWQRLRARGSGSRPGRPGPSRRSRSSSAASSASEVTGGFSR